LEAEQKQKKNHNPKKIKSWKQHSRIRVALVTGGSSGMAEPQHFTFRQKEPK
jgi:hypothetical protein